MKKSDKKNGRYLEFGYFRYYINGKLHRKNGPAVEGVDGDKLWRDKLWFKNGKLHREDGPAMESKKNGYKGWWINDKRHRIDGPAIEYDNGYKEWYLNDKRYTEEEYWNKLSQYYFINLSQNDINILQTLFSFYYLILPEIKINDIIQLKDKFTL